MKVVVMLRRFIRAIPWLILVGAVILAITGPPKTPAVGAWKQSRDIQSRLFCERSLVSPGTRYKIHAEFRNAGRKRITFSSGFYSAMDTSYLGRLEGEEIGDIKVPKAVISLEPGETYRFLWSSRKDFRLGNHSFGGGFSGFPAETITIWVFPWRVAAIVVAVIAGLLIVRRYRLLKRE